MKNFLTFCFILSSISFAFSQDEGKTLSFNFAKSDKRVARQTLLRTTKGVSGNGVLLIKTFKMPVKKVEPFVTFSARLEGSYLTADAIEVSIKKNDEKEWTVLNHFHEGEGNPNIWVSNMLEMDKTFKTITLKIEVKNPKTTVKIGRFRFYCPGNISTGSLEGAGSGGAGCDLPPSVLRQTWGAAKGLTDKIYSGSPTFTTVTHLIVHHSAGPNTSSSWAATVASIFDYHTQTNGWADVGYNYLIAPDGTLFVGRGGGNNVVGAHMCGYNANTMGVCLLGTYTDVEPTVQALEKLKALLAWKCVESNIDPLAKKNIVSYSSNMNTISGHRDGCSPNYTECPGDKTWALLPTIRNQVKAIVTACLTGTKDFTDIEFFKISPNPNKGNFTLDHDLLRLPRPRQHATGADDVVRRRTHAPSPAGTPRPEAAGQRRTLYRQQGKDVPRQPRRHAATGPRPKSCPARPVRGASPWSRAAAGFE